MAIGDDEDDPLGVAKRKTPSNFGFPAITDFSLPYWQRSRTRNTGNPLQDRMQGGTLPMLNRQNYSAAMNQSIPVGGFGLGALQQAGYSRGNPLDIFGGQQQQQSSQTDDPNRPFNISSSSYKAFTGQPFSMEDRPSNISPSSYQAYLNQAGPTVHFLPPGFTATTGSTGVPGSSPNDIHFLPPGFSSVQGVTNPQTKQLQFQPPQGQQQNQFQGLPSVLDMIRKQQEQQY